MPGNSDNQYTVHIKDDKANSIYKIITIHQANYYTTLSKCSADQIDHESSESCHHGSGSDESGSHIDGRAAITSLGGGSLGEKGSTQAGLHYTGSNSLPSIGSSSPGVSSSSSYQPSTGTNTGGKTSDKSLALFNTIVDSMRTTPQPGQPSHKTAPSDSKWLDDALDLAAALDNPEKYLADNKDGEDVTDNKDGIIESKLKPEEK
jgi:hypothetical protein